MPVVPLSTMAPTSEEKPSTRVFLAETHAAARSAMSARPPESAAPAFRRCKLFGGGAFVDHSRCNSRHADQALLLVASATSTLAAAQTPVPTTPANPAAGGPGRRYSLDRATTSAARAGAGDWQAEQPRDVRVPCGWYLSATARSRPRQCRAPCWPTRQRPRHRNSSFAGRWFDPRAAEDLIVSMRNATEPTAKVQQYIYARVAAGYWEDRRGAARGARRGGDGKDHFRGEAAAETEGGRRSEP